MRYSVPVKNERRVLCVFPHYTPAFGTFNHVVRRGPDGGMVLDREPIPPLPPELSAIIEEMK